MTPHHLILPVVSLLIAFGAIRYARMRCAQARRTLAVALPLVRRAPQLRRLARRLSLELRYERDRRRDLGARLSGALRVARAVKESGLSRDVRARRRCRDCLTQHSSAWFTADGGLIRCAQCTGERGLPVPDRREGTDGTTTDDAAHAAKGAKTC